MYLYIYISILHVCTCTYVASELKKLLRTVARRENKNGTRTWPHAVVSPALRAGDVLQDCAHAARPRTPNTALIASTYPAKLTRFLVCSIFEKYKRLCVNLKVSKNVFYDFHDFACSYKILNRKKTSVAESKAAKQ